MAVKGIIILILILSLLLAYLSRDSLRSPRSHGFLRFFAWEFMLAQVLLVVQDWFRNPFAWHQLISWSLLGLSLIPLAFGVRMLMTRGEASKSLRREPSLFTFEKTTVLVTNGVYKYIRHPLYGSLLFLSWGIFFKLPSLLGAILAFCATLLLIATALADERECLAYFGDDYREYMKHSKRFIPFVM
ncbi:MAG TPA: isoprenylcysteine carboxylmethyltransferase family protein [Rectinemataceae bacterium]|nr:isoprenylcysteine carboxylmethyltransferase family protein [Rectinemataceae bacterium]